ncbi:MAG: hypothetical protein AAF399_18155, partial [Bacteroidota bacterium]
MLDQLPENWLDYLMIFLGVVGGLVGIWITLRLLRKSKSAEEVEETPAPDSGNTKRPYLRINMDGQGQALPPPIRTTRSEPILAEPEKEELPDPLPQEPPPMPNRDRRPTIAISEVEAMELEQQASSSAAEIESVAEKPPAQERVRTYPKVAQFDPPSLSETGFPQLFPVKISQQSKTEMRLSLEVFGHTLILE